MARRILAAGSWLEIGRLKADDGLATIIRGGPRVEAASPFYKLGATCPLPNMEPAMPDLTSPSWWISAVVMGLLLNVGAAYLKNWIDRSVSSSTMWWRNRSKKRREAFEEMVQSMLKENEYEHATMLVSTVSNSSQHCLGMAIYALLLGVAAPTVFSARFAQTVSQSILLIMIIISYVLIYLSFSYHADLHRIEDARLEARRRLMAMTTD